MNDTNLTPFTSETAKANGEKGGKASGESKRAKKMLKEYLTELLSMQAPKEEIADNLSYNIGDTSNGAMVAIRTLKSAKSGDVKALRLLYEVLGELDKGKINIEIETQAAYDRGYKDGQAEIFELLSDDMLRELINTLKTGEKPKDNIVALADVCGLTYTGFRKETEEKPLLLPNGVLIYGESQLE